MFFGCLSSAAWPCSRCIRSESGRLLLPPLYLRQAIGGWIDSSHNLWWWLFSFYFSVHGMRTVITRTIRDFVFCVLSCSCKQNFFSHHIQPPTHLPPYTHTHTLCLLTPPCPGSVFVSSLMFGVTWFPPFGVLSVNVLDAGEDTGRPPY